MTLAYQTQVTAIGGRAGSAASADRRLRIEFSTPGVLGGDDGIGTNPEQLLAAAYAACFLSAIRKAAGDEGQTVAADANVTAKVGLCRETTTLDVALSVDLPGIEHAAVERIVTRAREICPFSRALDGNAGVRVLVV